MGTRAALTAGTVLSVAVTAVWSWTATLTAGPAAPLRLTRSLPASYAALASAPTGNGKALFAAVSAIYTLCLLASGLRARGKAQREDARGLDRAGDAEAAAVSGREA